MIEVFASEKGSVLVFSIMINGKVESLAGAVLKLKVVGNPNSPFSLVNSGTIGETQYVIVAGDFPVGTYVSFITYDKPPLFLLSQPFKIVSKPDPS